MRKKILRFASYLLCRYFKGEKVPFQKIKVDFSGFTQQEVKVLTMLSKIPAGRVWTYGELARKAGISGAARFVGSVMRKNRLPIILPCHRVVRSGGMLGRYSGGAGWKRTLLELEGVKITSRNAIIRHL